MYNLTEEISEKESLVLRTLAANGPMTSDEFVTQRGWYINSWAPSFTYLLKRKAVRRTGERRPTSHGGKAHVIEITDVGRAMLGLVLA